MERANLQSTVGPQCSGHLTESIYVRYAIGAEKDALAVGEQMDKFHREEREKAATAAQISNDSGVFSGGTTSPTERSKDRRKP
jgi:hypothetical protein